LNRIALDQALAAHEIETQASVFAVSIDVSRLNIAGLAKLDGTITEQFSREDLEKLAIRAVVAEKHLLGVDHREDEFAALFYDLKESVRLQKTGPELAEQIGQSSLLKMIYASNALGAESLAAIAGTPEEVA